MYISCSRAQRTSFDRFSNSYWLFRQDYISTRLQCFSFKEQRVLPGEQLIDMPVFFYIDPEFETDPRRDGINNLIFSYTFLKVSKENTTDAVNSNNSVPIQETNLKKNGPMQPRCPSLDLEPKGERDKEYNF